MCYECFAQEQQKPMGFDDRFSISTHTTAKHNGKELARKTKLHRKTELCDIFLQLNRRGTSFLQLRGRNARFALIASSLLKPVVMRSPLAHHSGTYVQP